MNIVKSVRWEGGIVIIDQRFLPEELVERKLTTLDDVCDAIRTLAVRGAPAIGIVGAMGLMMSMMAPQDVGSGEEYLAKLRKNAETIRATRPTAVNLPWALSRVVKAGEQARGDVGAIWQAISDEVLAIGAEDQTMCLAIGLHGLSLIKPGARILTHCNTGALATGGVGTALAPIYFAAERGLKPEVFADETRPLLQGSRLTAWELQQAGIPVTVLVDSAAATLMRDGKIDLVIVGADRIAANGEVANKIGTYALAIAAKHHGVPFYVAAPSSTVDPETATGTDIHIEQRAADEVRRTGGVATAPADVDVYNPAFDVTPASLISAIITDRGVHKPPYRFSA